MAYWREYAEEGIRTVVVTCTNGEFGDAPGGDQAGRGRSRRGRGAATRLAELDKACEILGVDVLEKLGYHDSGMADWEYKQPARRLLQRAHGGGAGRIVELLEQYRPRSSSPTTSRRLRAPGPHPGQPHRPVAAIERTDVPAKLYYTAFRWRAG